MGRYGRKWTIRCKIKQTTEEVGLLMAQVQTSPASCSCRPKPSEMAEAPQGTAQVLWLGGAGGGTKMDRIAF